MHARARACSRPGRSRLSRSADFDRVFRNGRSHAGREFVLYVFPRGGDEPARLGLSVSRKVGGAVERNRVKRLLREAFAAEGERLPAGTDAVVVARRDARVLAESQGLSGVRSALAGLIDRACSGSPASGAGGLAANAQSDTSESGRTGKSTAGSSEADATAEESWPKPMVRAEP